ncbi:hypothetical protein Q760_13540 [Cellulomonas cellasea DSM 20118]|uniref:Uncharacterized protein n=1 Tax=Cellulomonas cellasea DSM 20118 TaxID=1408250 RepID=A0A0A0BC62_9CELL|nr:hypothetical protein Q760_13540 [Cellulomonas cellasea DSM 20118]
MDPHEPAAVSAARGTERPGAQQWVPPVDACRPWLAELAAVRPEVAWRTCGSRRSRGSR